MRHKSVAIAFEVAAVALILAVAGTARLHGITCMSIANLLPDEARLGLSAATILVRKLFVMNYFQSSEPPLPQYFIAFFMSLFGKAPWTLKLAPACFGLASVLATYFAGRLLFSIGTGLAAAGIAALLPNFIFWGDVAYGSSFVVLFTALLLCFHALFIQTRKKRFLYLIALVAGLGFSTNMIMLYVSVAFLAALLFSGQYVFYIKDKKSLVVASAFFLLGAGFLLAYVVFSHKLSFHILDRSQADTMVRNWQGFKEALSQRFAMVQSYFSWVIITPFIYWPLTFITKRTLNKSVVFLSFFLLAFVSQSVVTWSGMYPEHLTVVVPVVALLIGSIVEIPGCFMKSAVKYAPLLIISVFSVLGWRLISNHELPSPANVCNTNLNAAMARSFNSMSPEHTLAATSETMLILSFHYFTTRAILPNPETIGITSPLCNRFRACPGHPDTVSFYSALTSVLDHDGNSSVCIDKQKSSYRFDKPVCAETLRELIAYFVGTENRNNVLLCQGEGDRKSSRHPTTILNSGLRNAMDEMKDDGLFLIKREQVLGANTTCDILHVSPNVKLTSRITPAAIYGKKKF